MSNIFMQFGPSKGSLSKFYPVIRQLVDGGHVIRYIAPQNVDEYLRPLGVMPISYDFTLLDNTRRTVRWDFSSPEEYWDYIGYSDMNWLTSKVTELSRLFDRFRPDLIVEGWGVLSNITAKALKLKCVSVTHSCYHPERKFKKLRWWDGNAKIVPTKLVELINEFFIRYGSSTISQFEELFTGDYTLIPSIPELDPLTDDNCFNTCYVSPMVWNQEKPYDDISFNNSNPTVFCYTGKFGDGTGNSGFKLLRAIIGSLKSEELNIILAVGHKDEKDIARGELEKNLPYEANIVVVESIPMSVAYGIADIIIHHGGYGSCIGQIIYEKPAVIISTHSEREYNARMCEKLGIGINLPLSDLKSDDLKKSIFTILGNKDYYNSSSVLSSFLLSRGYPSANTVIEKALDGESHKETIL